MSSYCPSCHQFFAETEGYCPYDGSRLQAPPAAISSQPGTVRAVSAHDNQAAALAALHQHANAQEAYDRLIGMTLDGRYYIERKIGEGGMGVVYAARHIVIEKQVAIKVLKREVARDHSTVKRFVQEAKAASRIGHPNIVDVTDFGTTPDGMTYSVMEFVDGMTLSAAIRQGAPFTLARALPIVAQIARALGAAHEKGIVHRDLKPENVFLLSRDGRTDFVKIVDFGIAKVTPLEGQSDDGPRLTRAGAVFGTPEYMAPEQAAGRNDTDQRVDVYALGTILYELVVGRVPHKADSMVRTLAMQMLDPIEPPSKLRPDLAFPPDFEAVVMKALAKKRELRYQTMKEMLGDLERVSGGVPLEQPVSPSAAVKVGSGALAAPPDVLTLVPQPPGADPVALNAERTTMRADGREKRGSTPPPRGTGEVPAGRTTTGKRLKNEPEFVTRRHKDGSAPPIPVTYEHVFTETDLQRDGEERSKWPLIVVIFLLFAGGGIAVGLIVTSQGKKNRVVVNDPRLDAGVIVDVNRDGGTGPGPQLDARGPDPRPIDGGVVIVDAGNTSSHDRIDGGRRPPKIDAGGVVTPRAELEVKVITKPEGGTLYAGNSYRGPSGVTLRELEGTSMTLRCTMPGYKEGKVDVRFDGLTEIYLCKMERDKKCIDALKNPFDDCPDPVVPTPPP